MKSVIEILAFTELPRMLAHFLELPEKQVSIPEKGKGPVSDFLVRAGKYAFLVESKGSGARAPILTAVNRLKQRKAERENDAIPLVVVPYMGETGLRFCEEQGIAWLDLSGNAYIKASGLLINVQGKPNRFKSAGRPPNIFAPKSSRIVRQLLSGFGRPFTQRELALTTGLDEGYTSRIVRRLEENGLVVRYEEGLLKSIDPDQLLDAWHEAYDFGRHHIVKGHVAARSGEELLHRIASILEKQAIDYAATGLGAAWLYTHFANFRLMAFYLTHPPGDELSNTLGFREDDQGANTWLVIPNDEGVFHGSEVREGIRCVHPVQVYLDLKAHPERSEEAAERLRQEYLQWKQDA
jgi:hypothetical protein